MDRDVGAGDALVFPSVDEGMSEECPHDSLHHLGADAGNNSYCRCTDCGAVVIVAGEAPPAESEVERTDSGGDPNAPSLMGGVGAGGDEAGTRARRPSGPEGIRPDTPLRDRLREVWKRLVE